jgi:hypothetical protein
MKFIDCQMKKNIKLMGLLDWMEKEFEEIKTKKGIDKFDR